MRGLLAVLILSTVALAQGGMGPGPGVKAYSGGAAASWGSRVQAVDLIYNTDCVFGDHCTKSMTFGSGNLIAIMSEQNGNAASYITAITAGACGGSGWQFPTNTQATGSGGIVAIAYCLSSNSGTYGTFTVTFGGGWNGRQVVRVEEWAYTGTASFINTGTAVAHGSLDTNPAGVALTLTGYTAYLTCQMIADAVGAVSCTSTGGCSTSPYAANFAAVTTTDSTGFAGFSCAPNNSSGTAPNWTTPNSLSTVSAIAFGVN